MQEIEHVCSSFSGSGLAAINLDTNEQLSLDADTLFPIASVLKVPVMLEVSCRPVKARSRSTIHSTR